MRSKLVMAIILLAVAFGAGYWSAYRRYSGMPTDTGARADYQLPRERTNGPQNVRSISEDGTAREWYQTTHLATPIRQDDEKKIEQIAPTKTELGELSFDLGDVGKLTFDPRSPESAKFERAVHCYAAFVTLELPHNISSKLTESRLFRVDCDAAAGSKINMMNEIKNVIWEVRTLAPVKPTEGAFQFGQNIGVGASFGGWRDADPCLTYSFLRLGRLRLPSAMADTGGHLGAGIQARIWKPFHAGGFCVWDITDDFRRSIRITATVNF